MPLYVGFRQFDTNGKHADGEYYPAHFECDGVGDFYATASPSSRIEYVRAIGTCLCVRLDSSARLKKRRSPMTTPKRNAHIASPMYNYTPLENQGREGENRGNTPFHG